MTKQVQALIWRGEELLLIDQRKLPHEQDYVSVQTLEEAHRAIREMVVRGAPLIGFTALYGMILALKNKDEANLEAFAHQGKFLKTARPTAVNLEFEINRCLSMAGEYEKEKGSLKGFQKSLEEFAAWQFKNLEQNNLVMAKLAKEELDQIYGVEKKLNLMTLCNTGALACGPRGTALGVISYLYEQKRVRHVYASETRPYLQGGRLTAYELSMEGIPHSLVVEGAHSYLLRNGLVDAVFIGADRIVSNGDTANKIGSSSLAIICSYYKVPFYVVAPLSSFDFSKRSGEEIVVELRPEEEVLACQGVRIAPSQSRALNPSFDITDHRLISGIICEKGLVRPRKDDIQKTLS